ncbi:MAG: hypothetical protein VX670_08395 [Candidatus Latescibacterota bacterium]|nr:hypothetical protein [Candidatus Latescibacterota bacterium]MEE2728703.1 hypothetical protein [Candidatus Latescibacterota bacterium]
MKSQAVWHPQAQSSTPLMLFRQRVVLAEELTAGRMLIGASGPFSVYVNGQLAARGSGERAQKLVGQSVDLTQGWTQGENTVLIAVLGSGESDWLRAECYVDEGLSTQREFHTGTPWEVWCDQAWLSGTPSAFIAESEKGEWARGIIGEENWQSVGVVLGPLLSEWEPIVAREAEVVARSVTAFGEVDAGSALDFVPFDLPMRSAKFVHCEALLDVGKTDALVQTRSPERAAYVVLDFGRVVYGYPRVRVRGRLGAIIDLGFACQSNALSEELRYVCADRKSDWTAPKAVACRYVLVRVSACPEEMELDSISIVEQQFVSEEENAFDAEDLVELWSVGLPSLVESRRESYLAEIGGARASWLEHYVLGLNDFYRAASVQTLEAALQSAGAPDSAEESAFFALCVAAQCRLSNRQALARQIAPVAEKAMENFADDVSHTATCALYAGAYRHLHEAYIASGEAERAEDCDRLSGQWNEVVSSRWSAQHGVLSDAESSGPTSEWTQVLALYFGLLSAEQAQSVAEMRTKFDEPINGPWQAFFLAGGLWQHGLVAQARACIDQHWGRLLTRPGTSWRARANAQEVVPGVDALLGCHVLGVNPLGAGNGAVEVRPQVDEPMQRVSGTVHVGSSALEVEWSLNGAGYFSLVVERDVEGELHLVIPRLNKRFPTIALNGETVWRNEKIYPNFHTHEIISEPHAVVLVVHKAGRYHAELSA